MAFGRAITPTWNAGVQPRALQAYKRATGRASAMGVVVTNTVTVTVAAPVTRFANISPEHPRKQTVPLKYRGKYGLNGKGR